MELVAGRRVERRATCTCGSRPGRGARREARRRVARPPRTRGRGGTRSPLGRGDARAPAVWKSAEISARRSQRRLGAIAASSARTSSASEPELTAARPRARAAVASAPAPRAPYPPIPFAATTRWHGMIERVAVLGAERPGRPRRAGPPGESSELAVRDDLAPRDRARGRGEVALQRRRPVEIDRDVRRTTSARRRGAPRTGGTDPARSRHGPVTTRPVAFVLGALLPHRGPSRGLAAGASRWSRRAPRGAEPRTRARAG